jgi:phosphopantothenate-cysteine ligase
VRFFVCHFEVKPEHASLVSALLLQHTTVNEAGILLSVEFTTLSDYLHLLQGTAQLLDQCGRSAMLYLAAAVSDFYIPACELVSHAYAVIE